MKYVKIKDFQGVHAGWYMVLTPTDNMPEGFEDTQTDRLIQATQDEFSKALQSGSKTYDILKVAYAHQHKVNYKKMLDKGHTLLIRQIGSYNILSPSMEIVDECYSNYYPVDGKYDIVVCENSVSGEPEWLDYLAKRFPDKIVRVVNLFWTRDRQEISEIFSKCSTITFYTTFTNTDWYNKILECASPSHAILGYTMDTDKWESVEVPENLEIVTSL
jgi:hypothetical protein